MTLVRTAIAVTALAFVGCGGDSGDRANVENGETGTSAATAAPEDPGEEACDLLREADRLVAREPTQAAAKMYQAAQRGSEADDPALRAAASAFLDSADGTEAEWALAYMDFGSACGL
jgi:hypothetical protein